MYLILFRADFPRTMNGVKQVIFIFHIFSMQMHNTNMHTMNGISFKFNKIKKTSLKVFAHNSELFLWTCNTSGRRYRRRVGARENRSNRKYFSVLCFVLFINLKQRTSHCVNQGCSKLLSEIHFPAKYSWNCAFRL